jgi:hypothetical protein
MDKATVVEEIRKRKQVIDKLLALEDPRDEAAIRRAIEENAITKRFTDNFNSSIACIEDGDTKEELKGLMGDLTLSRSDMLTKFLGVDRVRS